MGETRKRKTSKMLKSKFRDQQYGIFEKSLRCGTKTIAEKQQKGQWTEGESKRKNIASIVGEMQEHGGDKNATEKEQSVFYAHKIKKIMDEVLQEKLSNQTYDAQTCRVLCMTLTEDIKGRVKELGMERFRLICNVSIGSNSGQGVFMASRFLWNELKDNFSTSCFQNASLFAVGIVFGVSKE